MTAIISNLPIIILIIKRILDPSSASNDVIPVDKPDVVSAETDSNIEFKKV